MEWVDSQDIIATIRALRRQAEQARAQTLEAALLKLQRGAAPKDLLREVTRSLTNKLIHPPSARLNRLDAGDKEAMLRAVRSLYDLTPDNDLHSEEDT